MNDISPKVAAMVAEYYRRMTPLQRMETASDMFDTACLIVESSLPSSLSRREAALSVCAADVRQ